MITNAGLVAGLLVGIAFLLAGIMLVRAVGARAGGLLVTAGGLVLFAAQLYGLAVLRPFIGRTYDDQWYAQIAMVEGFSILGLLACAVGILLHARSLERRFGKP